MLGRSFLDIHSKGVQMRCLDYYGRHPEHDAAILIGIFIGKHRTRTYRAETEPSKEAKKAYSDKSSFLEIITEYYSASVSVEQLPHLSKQNSTLFSFAHPERMISFCNESEAERTEQRKRGNRFYLSLTLPILFNIQVFWSAFRCQWPLWSSTDAAASACSDTIRIQTILHVPITNRRPLKTKRKFGIPHENVNYSFSSIFWYVLFRFCSALF